MMLESTYFAVHSCFRYSKRITVTCDTINFNCILILCMYTCRKLSVMMIFGCLLHLQGSSWCCSALHSVKVSTTSLFLMLIYTVYMYMKHSLPPPPPPPQMIRNHVWGIISAVALLRRLQYWLKQLLRLLRLRRTQERVYVDLS